MQNRSLFFQVGRLSGENQEFEENNKRFKEFNQELSHLRTKQSEDVDMLEKTRDELQETKLHLHASIEKGEYFCLFIKF